MTTDHYPATARTTPSRKRERTTYDRAAIHAVLDEALICHLAYVVEFWHEDRVGVGVVEVALSPDFSRPVSAPRIVGKPGSAVQIGCRESGWQLASSSSLTTTT